MGSKSAFPDQNFALDTERIAVGCYVDNVRAVRVGSGDKEVAVHDVAFALIFQAFHANGELIGE